MKKKDDLKLESFKEVPERNRLKDLVDGDNDPSTGKRDDILPSLFAINGDHDDRNHHDSYDPDFERSL